MRRIHAYAWKKCPSLPGYDAADLESELLEVLWLACESYNPDRGAKFNTHFWNCAERRFLDLHKYASRQKRVGDYDAVIGLDGEEVRMAVSELLDFSAEDHALAILNVREIWTSEPE